MGFPTIETGSKNGRKHLTLKPSPISSSPTINASFAQVENAIEGIPEAETETRRLYTQRLFNRLMFLRFIEKKGWLTYNGDRNYLRALFDATAVSETDENFLNDRLFWAFFHGLGNAAGLREESGAAVERRGEVPFLNGGLL